MFFLPLTLISLWSWSADDCFKYAVQAFAKKNSELTLRIGERVRISAENGTLSQKAHFLGERKGTLFFSTNDLGTVVSLERQNVAVRRNGMQTELQPEALVKSDRQTQSMTCLPLAVLSCLRRLDQVGGISESWLQAALRGAPEDLFQKMNERFGSKMSYEGNWSNRSDYPRSIQHAAVLDFVKEAGVQGERTRSFRKLKAHLSKGNPAILSFNVGMVHRRVRDLQTGVTEYSVASFPLPTWSSAGVGYHALYVFGVIPHRNILEGPRLLVLDSFDNHVHLWPLNWARIVGDGAALLIRPQ